MLHEHVFLMHDRLGAACFYIKYRFIWDPKDLQTSADPLADIKG